MSITEKARRAFSRLEPCHAAVAAIVGVNLWMMRHLLLHVSWPNDVPFHVSMTQWATDRLSAGQLPLDGWYPRLSGGYPQFHMYQSLPHLITAGVGKVIGVETAFNLATYLLWCLWPIVIFIAARAFGLNKTASVVAALLAPMLASPVSYGFELGSYSWVGYGLWSQLWGMWAFPLALAWSARAVAEGRRFGRAGLAMAILVGTHLPTAWFAILAIGLWAVVRPSEIRRRVPRTVAMGIGSVAVAAWILVPLISDQWAAMSSTFNLNTDFADSFGWRKVLGFIFTGDINDNGRWPVVSIAAAVGLVVAIRNWGTAPIRWARELPLLLLAGTILFIGRNPFGWLIDLLPGSSMVFLHRYHIVIHFTSLLLAGVGVSAAAEWLVAVGVRLRDRMAAAGALVPGSASAAEPSAAPETEPAESALPVAETLAGPVTSSAGATRLARGSALVLVAALVIIPAAWHTSKAMDNDRTWVLRQQQADLTDGQDVASLVALAHKTGGGRIYGGRINNWGDKAKVGSAPLPILLGHYPIDQIGFNLRVSGLSGDLETYLNDMEIAQLRLLGIKFLLVPRAQPVPQEALLLAQSGNFYLYEVPESRWMETVNVIGPVWKVQKDALGESVLDALGSRSLQGFDRRLMSLDGRSGTSSTTEPGQGSPGRILTSDVDTAAGSFEADVVMERGGALVAKTNWNPRWKVTVDGKPAETFMVNPMQLAVQVPEGRHTVSFGYTAYSWYWVWFIIGGLALWALHQMPWFELRWQQRSARRSGPAMADNRSGDADAESHDDDSDALIDADIDGSLPRDGVDAGQSTPGALLVDAPGEIDLDGTASQGNNERPEGANE